jgi:hypothetical protein
MSELKTPHRSFAAGHFLARWIKQAKKDKMRFIISACDTFSYEDYPVYCKDEADLSEKRTKYEGQNMQTTNEILTVDDFVVNKDGSVEKVDRSKSTGELRRMAAAKNLHPALKPSVDDKKIRRVVERTCDRKKLGYAPQNYLIEYGMQCIKNYVKSTSKK